jgi:hypothetical protein
MAADVSFTVEAIDKSSTSINNIGASLKSLGLAALGPVAAFTTLTGAISATVAFMKESIKIAAEAETGMVRLEATLKATGRGAEISGAQISKMAESLMGMSTFDDEAIVNAYNTLMKYDSIPVDKMETVVKAAMDMSAALGGDLTSNAEMIGRVLETGVIPRSWAFDKALKAQVQSMISAGNAGGALSLVLGELNTSYGGQAAAQLNTYTGQVTALKVAWDEVKERVGGVILPHITLALQMENARMKAASLGISIVHNNGLYKTHTELLSEIAIAQGSWVIALEDTMRIGNTFIGVVTNMDGTLTRLGNTFSEVMPGMTEGLADYGAQLSAMSSFAMDYDKNIRDMAEPLKNLEDAQKLVTRAMEDAKWTGYAKDELWAALENVRILTEENGNLSGAYDRVNEAQRKYDEALKNSVGLGYAKNKLDEAKTAVQELEDAQQRQTDLWVLNVLTQQLSIDGLTSEEMKFLIQYQIDTGLITADAGKRAQAQWDYVLALQAGAGDYVSTVTTIYKTIQAGQTMGPSGIGSTGSTVVKTK